MGISFLSHNSPISSTYPQLIIPCNLNLLKHRSCDSTTFHPINSKAIGISLEHVNTKLKGEHYSHKK